MSTLYICGRCSRRIFLHAQRQLHQATFISLGKANGQDNTSALPPLGVEREDGGTPMLAKDQYQRRLDGLRGSQKQRSPKGVDQVLESLFASNQGQQSPTRSRYSRKPLALWDDKHPLRTMENLSSEPDPSFLPDIDASQIVNSGKLVSRYSNKPVERQDYLETRLFEISQQLRDLQRQLHNETAPIEEIWQSCAKIIESRAWKENARSVVFVQNGTFSVFLDILREVTRRRSIYVDGTSLSPIDVFAAYKRNGALRFWWHEVLWIQLGNILEVRQAESSKDKREIDIGRFGALLRDILQVWMTFVQFYQSLSEIEHRNSPSLSAKNLFHPVAPQAQGNHDSWRALSGTPGIGEAMPALPKQLSLRFRAMLGLVTQPQKMNSVAAAAILTLHYIKIFQAEDPSEGSLIADAEPFVRLLDRVALDVSWDCPGFEFCLKNVDVPNNIIDAARNDWARSPIEVVKTLPSLKDLSEATRKKAIFAWTEENIERLFNDLNHIKENSDAAEAAELWRRTKPVLRTNTLKDEHRRGQIFGRFLSTFFNAHQQDKAIEVWNHMVHIGHKPGLNHWNAMMHGCSFKKDISSLNGIWSNILRAKVQPDNQLWTTYIHGVFKTGKWQQGLALLDQLGREWRSTALTPSLAPVHGALSGLLSINKGGMLPTIIQWARSQGLRPTVHTYNILLRPLARSGTPQQMRAHLKTMAKNNCQPDIITYTMILNGLVHSEDSPFHNLTQEVQNATINSILTDMQVNKINPTAHTYTTILDGLLDSKYHEPNISAAQKVINHMNAAGIYPPPHVHVILLTHYFSVSPPNLHAIDGLLHTVLHNPSTAAKKLDHIFYDRLISNFAKIDEYEKALKFLKKMVGEGKAPSWAVLGNVLKSLERAKEWDLCAEVVEGVERGEIMKWGGDRRKGTAMEDFFAQVDTFRGRGLISDSTGPVEKQP
ncbi:MAG: hypothetical protein Q9217_006258 [Psora testacea]